MLQQRVGPEQVSECRYLTSVVTTDAVDEGSFAKSVDQTDAAKWLPFRSSEQKNPPSVKSPAPHHAIPDESVRLIKCALSPRTLHDRSPGADAARLTKRKLHQVTCVETVARICCN